MHELYFVNDGEIDIRCVTLMGFSAKPHESAIGMFGTGLKYAIAGVLRLGGQIEIWSGKTRCVFYVDREEIRGKSVDICLMQRSDLDEPSALPFTTQLGLGWEPWMLYRELWANAKDELGDVSTDEQQPAAGRTVVVVACEELAAAHESRSQFILTSVPLWSGSGLEIHPNNHSGRVYYQGLAVFKAPAGRSPTHTYNITSHVSLTEDRQANAYGVELAVTRGLLSWAGDGSELLENVLVATSGLESTFDLNWSGSSVTPSRNFLQTVARLRREGSLSKDSAVVKYSSGRDGWDFNYVTMPASDREAALLDEVRSTIVSLGIAKREELPDIVVSADVEDSDGWQEYGGTIYVAPEAFDGMSKLIREIAIWTLQRVGGKWSDSDQVEWLFDRLLVVIQPEQEFDFPEHELTEDETYENPNNDLSSTGWLE